MLQLIILLNIVKCFIVVFAFILACAILFLWLVLHPLLTNTRRYI